MRVGGICRKINWKIWNLEDFVSLLLSKRLIIK